MTLDEFCTKLQTLKLTDTKEALALLWFFDEATPDVSMTSGKLAGIMHNAGLGSPHSTRMGIAMVNTGLVIEGKGGLRLKTLARAKIREWIQSILGNVAPKVDQDLGYLPQDVWANTRGYVEKVCTQMNGCYQFAFYDASSVMMRRLVETLIIEAYERLGRESEIKDASQNYFMLRDLVNQATGARPLGLGRDAKEALAKIKELGDRSAHNRRYNAVKADMDKVQSGVRVVVDELINLASLRRATPVPAAS